jgi:hypothetical protein
MISKASGRTSRILICRTCVQKMAGQQERKLECRKMKS